MRTQLFRTQPVLINDAGVVVALKDIDGVNPFTLFLENRSIAASLRTRFGSKNANIRLVAATVGTVGNEISLEITAAVDQAFSVDVTPGPYYPDGGAITVNLRCDGDGIPNQFVSDLVDLLNADVDVAALVRVSRALGSDGSAHMELVDGDPTHAVALTYLTGGFDATVLGAVTVEYSALGAPDFAGPWVTLTAAGTALSTVGAEAVKSYAFVDVPFAGLRVKASKGAADTMVVATAIAEKKAV
jgi:hypothetical protein